MYQMHRGRNTQRKYFKYDQKIRTFESHLKNLRSKMPTYRTLSKMNFENCAEYVDKLSCKVVKTFPENFLAYVFILTVTMLIFEVYFCKYLYLHALQFFISDQYKIYVLRKQCSTCKNLSYSSFAITANIYQ